LKALSQKNNGATLEQINDELIIKGLELGFLDLLKSLGKKFSANVFNEMFNGNQRQEPEQTKQSFDMPEKTFREKEENSNIGGIFNLFSPEISGENHEEKAFIRRMKKKKRRRKHLISTLTCPK
jgi:hypothetical protein